MGSLLDLLTALNAMQLRALKNRNRRALVDEALARVIAATRQPVDDALDDLDGAARIAMRRMCSHENRRRARSVPAYACLDCGAIFQPRGGMQP